MRTRYVQLANGKLVPIEEREPVKLQIVPDINPYQSMATGEMITSRQEHREHLKRHNLVELGNENLTPKAAKIVDPRRKEKVAEIVNHFGEDRIRKDAAALGDFLKWNSRNRTL